MDPISKVKISDTSYEIKDGTARLAIVTLNNELDGKASSQTIASGSTDEQINAAIKDADRTKSIPYGEVDSTSTATAYTATVPGITELRDGVCMLLKNGVVTSASGFTINVNGLGAKPSYNNMTTGNDITPTAPTRDTTIFNINYTMLFIYSSTVVDGGAWICYRGYDANTNTLGYQLRTNSYVLNAANTFRYYQILFTSADGTKWVPANSNKSNSATTAKTVNQTPINPFGEIVYCGNSTNYSANAAVSATAIWQQYTVTFGYSFNKTGAALTLTTKKPVYVKCAPQSDGSAIIDSTTPYVQDLPSTEDGKIYILLGMAYSATAVELLMKHPVYYYKDGAIRQWTNGTSSGSVGTLNTNNYTSQTVSSSESLSGTIKLHKVAKTGNYDDLLGKPYSYYPETTTVPNVTSVGSASTWNFAMGTGSDEHTLIISGGNGSAPSLGTVKTVATGNLTNGGVSDMLPLHTDGFINGGGSND